MTNFTESQSDSNSDDEARIKDLQDLINLHNETINIYRRELYYLKKKLAIDP